LLGQRGKKMGRYHNNNTEGFFVSQMVAEANTLMFEAVSMGLRWGPWVPNSDDGDGGGGDDNGGGGGGDAPSHLKHRQFRLGSELLNKTFESVFKPGYPCLQRWRVGWKRCCQKTASPCGLG